MRIFFFLAISIFLFQINCFSQKGKTTLGIQYKPIFPLDFLGTGKITNDSAGVHFETILNSGYNFGVVVRHNFTDLLAIESGINYVKRDYRLTIIDGTFTGVSSLRSISFEIPVVFMVYAQLGEKIYINGSMGPTFDIFPSNLQVQEDYLNHVAFRNHIFQPAISANLGWEYRTDKSGVFYIGASYQRPFSFIYLSKVGYYGNQKEVIVENELTGSYLTIDLRYFFPETKTKNAQ